MKNYRVWTANATIDIEAEKIEFTYDELPKIRFLDYKDHTLAEFYRDKIAGWAELECIADANHSTGDMEPKWIVKLPYMVDTGMPKALANSVFGLNNSC